MADLDQFLSEMIAREEGIPVEQVTLDHIRTEREKPEFQKMPVTGGSPYLETHSRAEIELLRKKAEDFFLREIGPTSSR